MAEHVQPKKIELKVAATSNPASVAGAIAKNYQEGKEVFLIAVGAGSVNQMTKAVAIASGYLAPSGISIGAKIGFTDTVIIDDAGNQKDRTAMLFKIIEV
jgi:stage V sporulation protein SpoVS